MFTSWRVLVAVVVLLCAVMPLAASAADVLGTYSCRGTNPDGTPYDGTVAIEENGGGYVVHWTIGTLKYSGAGIVTDDILSASWGSGVVVYRIERGGRLVGKWLNVSGGEMGTETLTPR